MKPKDRYMENVIFFSLIGVCMLGACASTAQEKALTLTISVQYIRNGQVYEDQAIFSGDLIQAPGAATYDGCLTSKGNPYIHAHLPDWTVTLHGVTKAEVEAWYELNDPATVIQPGTATFAYNCHGYTTGKNQWIWPHPNSIGVILEDEYEAKGLLLGGRYAFEDSDNGAPDHSFVITDTCLVTYELSSCIGAASYMTDMREKDGYGPIRWPLICCDDRYDGTDDPTPGDNNTYVVMDRK